MVWPVLRIDKSHALMIQPDYPIFIICENIENHGKNRANIYLFIAVAIKYYLLEIATKNGGVPEAEVVQKQQFNEI